MAEESRTPSGRVRSRVPSIPDIRDSTERSDPAGGAASTRPAAARSWGPAARITRALLRRFCTHLTGAPFQVTYWDGTSDRFGDGPPAFHVTFRTPSAVWRVIRRPDPEFGDAYVDGDVEVDHLGPLLALVLRARAPLICRLRLPAGNLRGTPVSRQYQEIQSHYDRGNAFFALWLDASRTYSCAYFRCETDDLSIAQRRKVDHVLRKAQLRPGETLLDIGSGWGGLILRAAQQYGARAHGITLSRQQYDFTREAIDTENLAGQVSVALMDYRELPARGVTFDRVVSVGMLEHVGRRNLPLFMETVRRVLKPEGIGVLHFISRTREAPVGPWIRRHIFPGGYIPSWREVISLLPEFGFHLIDAESLRRHYALTLLQWARRFEERLDEVRALGFDETFIRTWRLYLRACAVGFQAGTLDLHQLTFTHEINNALPLTREYLYSAAEPARGAAAAAEAAG